ncbi:bifunctional riboflavin kinase/FAD synthetase [Thalassotalea sp. LPB0316]|uniref:bifunctional riboflavin kinase/FAD synthetase n=1 Tax=Thalassotalea sp. LPB0316 TaxID=2769490 RepID=UPI001866E93D|nr:bifunctional riboflavin kinase/FAD synthetase [Thalassotalea sp. LPB0316]QOL25780.1 bifunctional riboflavin kinase/FAD synthetase [Thalassotalea sp. LPB0316]
MQLIRGINNIQPEDHGCVLTIGNFDGVHLGHQRVIEALIEKAKQHNAVPTVMVFEPQPQELFAGDKAPARLTRLRDKYRYLAELGVERLMCVSFSKAFASQTAQTFIEELLVKRLGVKHLIIGDDFRFGKQRQGDFNMLKVYGERLGFSVTDTASFKLEDCRISSTAIRQALEQDHLAEAARMLGRDYAISGKVFHGEKNGRKFGFPTANVSLKRRVSPVSGVYAVRVKHNEQEYFGVANIGCRPTLAGVRQQLEVHIFDFNQMIYGQHIEVIMLKKLRAERKFDSLDALTQQIKIDSEQAKDFVSALV